MVLSSPSGFTSGSAGGDLDLCSLGVAHGLSESGPREPVTNDGMVMAAWISTLSPATWPGVALNSTS
jgi:hypothetical protein